MNCGGLTLAGVNPSDNSAFVLPLFNTPKMPFDNCHFQTSTQVVKKYPAEKFSHAIVILFAFRNSSNRTDDKWIRRNN
jgi:hypothetical protein